MTDSSDWNPKSKEGEQANELPASDQMTSHTSSQAHQIYPNIDANSGTVSINQVINADEADLNTRLSKAIAKQPIFAWISVVISIITLVIAAFVLGRVTTSAVQPTPASVAIMAATYAPNPMSPANQDLGDLRNQIQGLRDQVASLAKQQTPVEWPAALLTAILVLGFLALAGFLLMRHVQSQDRPEKEGQGTGRRAGCIGWIALASAVLTAIFIPISQNLTAWVPTPVIPCLFEPDRCGYPKPTLASQSLSGTITVTATFEPTPSIDPPMSPTATALATPTRLPTSTVPPTPSLTAESTPDPTSISTLYTPVPPVIINNYIYACTSSRTTSSRVTCVTPTSDP